MHRLSFVVLIAFSLSSCLPYENPSACRFGGFRHVLLEPLLSLLEETFPAFGIPRHCRPAARTQQLPKFAVLLKIILVPLPQGPKSYSLPGFFSTLSNHRAILVTEQAGSWLWGSVSLLALCSRPWLFSRLSSFPNKYLSVAHTATLFQQGPKETGESCQYGLLGCFFYNSPSAPMPSGCHAPTRGTGQRIPSPQTTAPGLPGAPRVWES